MFKSGIITFIFFSLLFSRAQTGSIDPLVSALKTGKKSEVLKCYLSNNEMCDLSWLVAEQIGKVFNKKHKPKFTKEAFRQKFDSTRMYYHERTNVSNYFDIFFQDSLKFNFRLIKTDRYVAADAMTILLKKSGHTITHKDSLSIKKIPEIRLVTRKFSDGKSAIEFQTTEIKLAGKWKFIERPHVNAALTEQQLDSVFYIALRRYFFKEQPEKKFVTVWLQNNTNGQQDEICIETPEFHKLFLYTHKIKDTVKNETDIFKIFKSRTWAVNDTFFNYLTARYGVSPLESDYHFTNLKNTQEILEELKKDVFPSRRTSEKRIWLARYLFNHGILMNFYNNGEEIQTEVVVKFE